MNLRYLFAKRSMIATITLIFFLWAIWAAGAAGYSRLLSNQAVESNQLALAERAIQLTPSDPEAHLARATVLYNSENHREAFKEYERATALRPHDYFLWFRLGFAHYYANDAQGAVVPFKEAVRRAPFYAQPHLMYGTTLFSVQEREQAFAEVRRAVISDPELLGRLIEIAMAQYGDDAQAIEQAVQPQTPSARLTLARSFISSGKIAEAMNLFRTTKDIPEKDWREFLTDLLAAKRFTEAYEVWATGHTEESRTLHGGIASITDGGFESRIRLDESGFGWQIMRGMPSVQVSLDSNQPYAGARSLRVDFNGASDPSARIISQLVLVEPNTRYRLSLAARTQEVVSGGLPLITVLDANGDERMLAQSKVLSQGPSGWQDYMVEFTTPRATNAVIIAVQRQNCSSGPCPIFGHLWLDSFVLNK